MKRFAMVLGGAIVASCTPIEPVPISNAPVNRCGCEAYGPEVTCNATADRCQLASRPPFPFFLVAHVPDSSYYAAAQTFVLYSGPGAGAPTFTRRQSATAPTNCIGETCAELGGMTLVSSLYRVTASQSKRVGFPLKEGQLIPARVELEPVSADLAIAGAAQPDFPAGLPIESRFVAPRFGTEGAETSTSLPSGTYRRILYPEPPFDALFPPRARAVAPNPVTGLFSETLVFAPPPYPKLAERAPDYLAQPDEFVLSDSSLDPPDTRSVTVQRAEGLDGWQVWVADRTTKRRISTLKTLSGTLQTVTLDTSGEKRSLNNQGLGDDVEVVVAPPPSYIGTPRFINPVNGGDLGTIRYPVVNAPVPVRGNVLQPGEDLGFAARLSFESTNIQTRVDELGNPLLHYTASLSTDDHGLFATVLPPGTYNVTVEPLPGTGFAKDRQTVLVNVPKPGEAAAVILRPPHLTSVHGRVELVDGRPVAEAEILATPKTPTSAGVPKPRPNQTRTGLDGRFSLDLDQGDFVITAVPKPGTGYPRVATSVQILPGDQELSKVTIPAPFVLFFTLRDARAGNENPVANAVVRVFTVPGASDPSTATSEAVEIGVATSDGAGNVEILLAPNPP